MPSWVLCFRVAEKLGGAVTPMDVAPTLDPALDGWSPAAWTKAALDLMGAEYLIQKRQRDKDAMKASKSRAKGKMGGSGALGN